MPQSTDIIWMVVDGYGCDGHRDYLYRESACPPRDSGCARSPHGDDWPTWKADFFAPAAAALLAAPWIVVRGNHEICSRAGAGYFRLLDPTLAQTAPPCIDLIRHFTIMVADQSFIVLDSSNAADTCPCDSDPWSCGQHLAVGSSPTGIALALAGHIHIAEVLSFADKRAPQFILGTGGTLLAGKIKEDLSGKKIAGTRVSFGRSDHRFGFAMIEPAPQRFTATFRDTAGDRLFACKLEPGEVACN